MLYREKKVFFSSQNYFNMVKCNHIPTGNQMESLWNLELKWRLFNAISIYLNNLYRLNEVDFCWFIQSNTHQKVNKLSKLAKKYLLELPNDFTDKSTMNHYIILTHHPKMFTTHNLVMYNYLVECVQPESMAQNLLIHLKIILLDSCCGQTKKQTKQNNYQWLVFDLM